MSSITRRAKALLATAALFAFAFPFTSADAQVPVEDAEFSASATGTIVHATLLEGVRPDTGEVARLVDTEVSFSAAATDTSGVSAFQNEMSSFVVPEGVSAQSYAAGEALDLAIGEPTEAESQIQDLAPKAEAQTGDDFVKRSLGDRVLDADPLLYGDALEATAGAFDAPAECVIGEDLARGTSHIVDVEALDLTDTDAGGESLEAPILALNSPDNGRAVSESMSHTRLVPNGDNAFGIIGEARETIAPVTLFTGSENQTTIEIAGEWVLRATDLGDGDAAVHFGPGEVSPNTPLLRIIDAVGEVTDRVTVEQITGGEPIEIPIEDEDSGSVLLNVTIGEQPREIADNTWAVDVVRINVLEVPDPGVKVGEIRVGHMEVSATAPDGGITCPLDVSKSADPGSVTAGEGFKTVITVDNPYDAPLENVAIVDSISVTEGNPSYSVESTDPAADSASKNKATWTGLGPIAPGESLSVTVNFATESAPDCEDAVISDDAAVTADISSDTAEGGSDAVQLTGQASADVEVTCEPDSTSTTSSTVVPTTATVLPTEVTQPPDLPRTGGSGTASMLAIGAVTLGGGIMLTKYLGLVPAVVRRRND